MQCVAGYCYKYTRATYDWLCAPGSHIKMIHIQSTLDQFCTLNSPALVCLWFIFISSFLIIHICVFSFRTVLTWRTYACEWLLQKAVLARTETWGNFGTVFDLLWVTYSHMCERKTTSHPPRTLTDWGSFVTPSQKYEDWYHIVYLKELPQEQIWIETLPFLSCSSGNKQAVCYLWIICHFWEVWPCFRFWLKVLIFTISVLPRKLSIDLASYLLFCLSQHSSLRTKFSPHIPVSCICAQLTVRVKRV